jgi:hypothetical protein
MKNTLPNLPEVLKIVAEFAESAYPGFEYATIRVRLREGIPDAEFPVNRLQLQHLDDVSSAPS